MNTIQCICMECQTVFQADYCKPLECPACGRDLPQVRRRDAPAGLDMPPLPESAA